MLLGAFAGLRDGEVCGLRIADVDFMRGIIVPTVQYPAEPLKTETSKAALPIPQSLALALSAHVAQWAGEETVFVNEWGDQLGPWALQRAIRTARAKVPGLPPDFRFHDLRHYLASMLIASGADVKVVQARLRHASAKTTLDTYAHLWPDSDESTRSAIDAVMAARAGVASVSRLRVAVSLGLCGDDGADLVSRRRADLIPQGVEDRGLGLRGCGDRERVGLLQFLRVVGREQDEQVRSGEQLDAPLCQPVLREVSDVVGDEDRCLGGQGRRDDVPVLRVHIDLVDDLEVSRAHLNESLGQVVAESDLKFSGVLR